MVKINIRDQNFGGEPSSCHKGVNKHVIWEFNNNLVSNSCFITDLCLPDVYKAAAVKRKVAWILEPRAIHPQVYAWIEANNRLFDFVLTFDEELIAKGENYLYYPHGRCWINNYVETPKTNFCSIIASSKDFTEGHRLRHKVIAEHRDLIDVFGYGYKPVENKEEALSSYKFSVTIENCRQPGYWTEKVVDCFATKTIPILWADDAVCDFFNKDGIIFFDKSDDLNSLLRDLSKTYYDSCADAIEENFKLVDKYRIPEDWIYENYPFLMN